MLLYIAIKKVQIKLACQVVNIGEQRINIKYQDFRSFIRISMKEIQMVNICMGDKNNIYKCNFK